ncbi:MAG: hypothetical protein GXY53_06390, partial [Desulfobulbus sp.]|nr:hypothetical protein [Desulfobulbus sp.]
LSWEPARLLSGRIRLKNIHAANTRLLLGTSDEDTVLPPFTLPILLELDRLVLENVRIVSDKEEVWHITTAALSSLAYKDELLRIQRIELHSDVVSLTATGSLRTNLDYPMEAEVTGSLHPEGYTAVPGRCRIDGPLNDLHITGTFESPLAFEIKGHLKDLMTTAPTWQIRGSSPLLTPRALHVTWPDQTLSELTVEGQGTFDAYFLQIHTKIPVPGHNKPIRVGADLRGNGQGLAIKNLRLQHEKTELRTQGEVKWAPHLSWYAEVNGTHLNPALLYEDWPGDMAAVFKTSGQLTTRGVNASLHVTGLQGTVRRQKIDGTGEVYVENNQLRIPALTLQSGGSSLRIKGNVGDDLGLLLTFDSPDLTDFWPDASGRLSANGRFSGSIKKPDIDFKLTGNNLEIAGNKAQKIILEAKGTLSGDGDIHGLVRSEKMKFGDISMSTGSLRLTGSTRRCQVEFDGQTNLGSTGFSMDGTVSNDRWQGKIHRVRFLSKPYGNWRQHQAAEALVSADGVDIAPLCLNSTSSRLCIGGSWQAKDNSWQLQGETTELPLSLLNLPPFTADRLSGSLNGKLAVTGSQDQVQTARLTVDTYGMSLAVPFTDDQRHIVKWKTNVLQAEYAKGILQSSLVSELTDGSTLNGTVTWATDRLSPDRFLKAGVNGSMHVKLLDLSAITLLTDRKVHPSGIIEGKFLVSGTSLTPVIQGQLELQNGQAEIPPLGITLSPLTINITGDGRNLHFLATARSGEGTINAESEVPLDRLTTGLYEIRLNGETFQAARIPGLDLVVSPDIRLTFDHRQIEARGTVTVPHAGITSIDFDQGLAPSADVVIIDDVEDNENTAPLPFFFDITVLTGNDVLINAHGLRSYIDGKLTVQKQPGRPLTGNGLLSVRDASFTLYGRRLKIDLGRLVFSGGPLTNPGIELRSERKSKKVTTGVIIDGFLQKPNMNFYSTPPLEQSTIITSLLESTAIGGETRQEIGMVGTVADTIGLGGLVPYLQSIKELAMIDVIKFEPSDTSDSFSLVFGSWLTPNFYVSYGKDLTDEAATFSTRYNLGNGFFLLTETGTLHNSGDIKYEFEQ